MPTLVTVSNINASAPYEIYIGVSGSPTYYYVDVIGAAQLPYDFTVPIPLQNNLGFCVRVIDSEGCIITDCFIVN